MRRLPFPALRAYTYAMLLVGCQSPVAPDRPLPRTQPGQPGQPGQPAEPSLSFEIAGPSQINTNGTFSWGAFAFGGSGGYQYRWDVARQPGQQPTTVTYGRNVSLLVTDTDGDLLLRLTVTSDNQTRVESLTVRNCIGGCK